MSKLDDLLASLSDTSLKGVHEISPKRENPQVYRMVVLSYGERSSSTYPLTQEEYAAYQRKMNGHSSTTPGHLRPKVAPEILVFEGST